MMKKLIFFAFVFSVFIFSSCRQSCKHDHSGDIPAQNQSLNEHTTLAVLYQQSAAEVRALQYQAFNLAKLVLDQKLSAHKGSKKPAIVVDIDETILDNSRFQAQCILGNFSYPEKWDDWCLLAEAPAIPGSVDFLNYAHNKGVAVFYVTNRKAHLEEATVKNLISEGFPNLNASFLMFRTDESSKNVRRATIEENHEILMLFGDNLHDFSGEWEKKSVEERNAITDSLGYMFGNIYFVLPNSTYGDWEGAYYNHDFTHDQATKDSLRKQALKGF
jgi:5'-nucleotidase (lipoprotein e(P4) family)